MLLAIVGLSTSRRCAVQQHVGCIRAALQADVDVRVASVDGKGLGVFAVEPVPAGEVICSYEGTVATDEECDARYPPIPDGADRATGVGDYVFRLTDGLVLDAQNSTHFSRYFNHAEHGNLEADVSADERRIRFRSLRRIEAGEELTFDYGMHYWRSRDAPVGDSRDYSAEAWARRDRYDDWVAGSLDEQELIRSWRVRVPRQASLRHDAALIVAYLLYKNPSGHGVAEPLPAQRVNQLAAHLEAHREESDGRHAVLDVYAALERHAKRRHIEEMADVIHCWLQVGERAEVS